MCQRQSGRVEAVTSSALIFYYDKLIDLTARGQLNRASLKALIRDQYELQRAAQEEAARSFAEPARGPERWCHVSIATR